MAKKEKGTTVEKSGGGIKPWGARRTVPPRAQLPVAVSAGAAALLIFAAGGTIPVLIGVVICLVLLVYLATPGRK